MSEARLRRYEKWVIAAAFFVSVQVTGYLENMHRVHGGVGLLVQQWMRRRARTQGLPGHLRVLRWLNAALLLHDGWWSSPVQIARAWLISGVAIGAVAFAVYGEVGTATFVGITFPALVLAGSVWHFRHPPESESQPVPG